MYNKSNLIHKMTTQNVKDVKETTRDTRDTRDTIDTIDKPKYKMVLCSSECQDKSLDNNGLWRRIRVVDFESLFTRNYT